MRNFKLTNPKTVEEAVSMLAAGTYLRAGGTDILGVLKDEILPEYPSAIINLQTIPGLSYIKEEGNVLKIGAMTVLEDIARNDIVNTKYSALAQAAARTASPHIREMGTLAGNICQMNRCWFFRYPDNHFSCLRKDESGLCYALLGENRYHSIFGAASGCVAVNPSDTAPALVVLNATVFTSKRSIPIDEFFTAKIAPSGFGSTVLEDDEVVTEIQVPSPSAATKSAFVKMALRKSIDFPVVNCAAAIGDGNARICMNAVYNNPRRATAAEDFIKDKTIDESTAEAAGAEAIKGSVALSHNKWKIQVARTMVKRAILACK